MPFANRGPCKKLATVSWVPFKIKVIVNPNNRQMLRFNFKQKLPITLYSLFSAHANSVTYGT